MLDIGWQELIVIAVIAIIVISPKDLPQAIRAVSQFARQLRGLSREFRNGLNELVREAELDELKREVQKVKPHDHLDDFTAFSDPTNSLSEDLDPRQFARERKRRVSSEVPPTVDAIDRRASGNAHPDDGGGTHKDVRGDPASAQVDKKTSV